MDFINAFLAFMRDPKEWLTGVLSLYGAWVYALLFLVIFCETGLVVTPFLPGESLLFAAGAVARSAGTLNPWLLFALLLAAAILGDTVNYWIGHKLGPAMLSKPNSRILKKEYIDKTHHFFEKYGGKTIILGRFVPFVRTFAPFLAGVGEMTYSKFLLYNVVGALAWVGLAFGAGYLFGGLPFVEENMTLILIAVVLVSLVPAMYEYFSHKIQARKDGPGESGQAGGIGEA
jgi:membrane-associated protein